MKVVRLQGVLMDNGEFICFGKTIMLNEEMIKKFVSEDK